MFADARARDILHEAISATRNNHPFELDAFVLLNEHFHTLMTLPPGEADYPTRWSAIKSHFTREWLRGRGTEQRRSASRVRHRRRGVWQRHFYEHLIRDEDDLINHLNYIHYNPVKHGLARCPHAWPHSSFHRLVEQRLYDPTWSCSCARRIVRPPDFSWATDDME